MVKALQVANMKHQPNFGEALGELEMISNKSLSLDDWDWPNPPRHGFIHVFGGNAKILGFQPNLVNLLVCDLPFALVVMILVAILGHYHPSPACLRGASYT